MFIIESLNLKNIFKKCELNCRITVLAEVICFFDKY